MILMDGNQQLEKDAEAAFAELDHEKLERELPAKIREVRGSVLKRGINSVHEAFADYMLLNPGCRLREMSAVFGYSVAWISTVTNSDMFKAYFAQRRSGVAVSIAQSLPERLAAAAALATERVMEVIERTDDAEILIDAFDKVLHRYGYAPNAKNGAQAANVNIQNNNFFLDKNELAAARQKLLTAHAGQPALPEREVKGELLGDHESVPAS